jgi:hypothetical protein
MRKVLALALAGVLVAAFVIPASALENEFGGYWRTRAVTQQNFTGESKTQAWDDSFVDTRTRLYYTAKINQDLKFVNRFEFNAVWGDNYGGKIGTDGNTIFRVKHSYADFNLSPVNFKVGLQDAVLSRGFLFNDDFAGAIITFKGEGIDIPFIWIKGYEGGKGAVANGTDYDSNNKGDFDFYGIFPSFSVGEMVKIKPFGMWGSSDKANAWQSAYNPFAGSTTVTVKDATGAATGTTSVTGTASSAANLHTPLGTSGGSPQQTVASYDKINMYYVGLDLDAKFDMGNVWFSGIYQGGKADLTAASSKGLAYNSRDIQAWLAAAGAKVQMGMADVHGQFFYATGDDNSNDDKLQSFFFPSIGDTTGPAYVWAEIMGYGIFDTGGNYGASGGGGTYNTSRNSCGDKISNVMAGNLGTTVKPAADVPLSITLDVWYAKLVKGIDATDPVSKVKANEDYLGTEVDLVFTYELVKNLKLDLVGAYLFAGGATQVNAATGAKLTDTANPYEVGARLSLNF